MNSLPGFYIDGFLNCNFNDTNLSFGGQQGCFKAELEVKDRDVEGTD